MTTATDTLRTDAIAQYRVLGEETDPGLEALARLAATVCATSAAAVNLIDDRLQHTVAVVGIQPGVCRRDDSMCAVVFEDGQTVVVDDARADARFADNPFVTGPLAHVRFYASSPLITPDGVAIGTLCVFGDDVAELNATQAEGLELLARQAVDVLELRRHSHELVRSNDQLTQFAARISHDLRNPLTAIAGQIELAADALAADDTEGAIRSLSHAEAAAGRMDGMITSLLAFARRGGARPQRAAVRLSDIVADALDDLESAIEGTHAVVTVDAPSDGLVSGDPALLRVLVQNLVANAVKFTQAAGVSPVIDIAARPSGDAWTITIDDNGPGVAPELRERAFSLLDRGNAGDVPGLGLGLATSRLIVGAHDGRIVLDDSPLGGARVRVTLPSAPVLTP
ncbi:sensor histidine kinase [Microbacterium paulum]